MISIFKMIDRNVLKQLHFDLYLLETGKLLTNDNL